MDEPLPQKPGAMRPLCVDLDGTLVSTDTLWESLLLLLKKAPYRIFGLFLALAGGRPKLKRHLAALAPVDPATLPYRQSVLDLAQNARETGRRVLLVTASDQATATAIADHVEVFDEAVGSDGHENLKAERKAEFLTSRFGRGGFDYVGDTEADIPVWEAAGNAILVAPTAKTRRGAERATEHVTVLEERPSTWKAALKELRPHQWAKNVLLFVPIYFAHAYNDLGKVFSATMAFLAFSFCASSIYVLNDLVDLSVDRRHRSKKKRPLASGALSIPQGLVLMVVSFCLALFLAIRFVNPEFVWVMLGYVVLTTIYSFSLKQKLIIDVLTLASLFTYRVLAGAVAVKVELSFWLLAFSIFFFTSLAFVKRYSELIQLSQNDERELSGRAYRFEDIPIVTSVGPASGLLAVLVFALYIDSPEISKYYSTPQALWGICLVLMYWIIRIWFLAAREEMHDDPVLFAVRDKLSLALGALAVACLLFARF